MMLVRGRLKSFQTAFLSLPCEGVEDGHQAEHRADEILV